MAGQFVSVELKGAKEALETFNPKLVMKAIRSTLDKSATQMKKEFVTEISSRYNISSKDIRSTIKTIRTSLKSFEAKLRIMSRKLSLVYFKGHQTPKGVLATIKKGKLTFIPHAFIQTMPTGYKGAFKRKGIKRYPIKHMPGPSITEISGSENILPKIQTKIQEFMDKTLLQEIQKRLKK
jgi:hypothetical protein